jgi:hypothetical protein
MWYVEKTMKRRFLRKGTTFCGGSCAISLTKPQLLASLNKRETGVLIVNVK